MFVTCIALCLLAIHLTAGHADKAMTNPDVLALASAGLSDDIIIAKIHASPQTSFDTSVEGLKALKAAGLSNAVIHSMVVAGTEPAKEPETKAPKVDASSANPEDPHPAGIYMYANSAGSPALRELQRATPKQGKSSGALVSGLTYGIKKAKVLLVIDGANSPIKTSDASTAFYLYSPQQDGTFGGSYTKPEAFSLIQLTQKGNSREIVVGSAGISGSKFGVDDQARRSFTASKVKPGIYKLTPDQPLAPGEYAFALNMGTFFDFRIVVPE
jgi:hypothetical protein